MLILWLNFDELWLGSAINFVDYTPARKFFDNLLTKLPALKFVPDLYWIIIVNIV